MQSAVCLYLYVLFSCFLYIYKVSRLVVYVLWVCMHVCLALDVKYLPVCFVHYVLQDLCCE